MKSQKYIIFISLLLFLPAIFLSFLVEKGIYITFLDKSFIENCLIGLAMSSLVSFFIAISTYASEKIDIYSEYDRLFLKLYVEKQIFLNWVKQYETENNGLEIPKKAVQSSNILKLYSVYNEICILNKKFSPIFILTKKPTSKIGMLLQNFLPQKLFNKSKLVYTFFESSKDILANLYTIYAGLTLNKIKLSELNALSLDDTIEKSLTEIIKQLNGDSDSTKHENAFKDFIFDNLHIKVET